MPRRLLFLVVIILLYGCFPIAICRTATPTAQQLKEIAKLRSELNVKLAGDTEREGVVVQPGWTKHSPASGSQGSKVIVNDANLRSAAAWRQEIQQAVATQGNTKEVEALDAQVKAQQDKKASVGNVGSIQDEMLGASLEPIPDQKGEPNVVDSSFHMELDLEKLQLLELSKRRTREMLILKGVEENFNINLELGIIQYLQLRHNGSNYILGRRINDMVIYREDFTILQIVQLPGSIHAMESFDWFLLIASEKNIIWLRLEGEEGGLKSFWLWPMGYEIERFRLFAVDRGTYLISNHNQSLNIFSIDLETQEFGIIQHMQMRKDITAMSLLDTGRDLCLALGHSDEVLIYLHNLGNDFLNFRFSERIEAENLIDITSFQMGGRSYLALGGTLPKIVYYDQGKFLPRTILGQNFGLVESYLPLPIRSYRDDLLLLIQHRVDFDPHFLVVIDLVIWNGEAFEASLPPPCHVMNHISYGLQCIIDDRRIEGLRGALFMGQQLLLVPRQNPAPTGVFHLQTELLPRNSELHDLQEIYEFMQQWVKEEDNLQELSEKLLLPSTGNFESFDEIFAPEVINDGNAQIKQLLVNDMTWSPQEDSKLNLLHLLEDIKALEREIVDQQPKRGKRQIPVDLFRFHYESLDFDAVEVEELFLKQLNQENFYIQNATLQFPQGSLNVENFELLEIFEGKEMGKKESLVLDNDLEFEYINGQSWQKFIAQDVVWRDQPLQLDELEVEGPIIFEDSLHLTSLNELSFPDDYLWSQGNSTTIIQAPKEFTQTLSVNSMDTSGTINGIDPLDAITLSDDQDWPGTITFTQLEVSEEMEVKGRAQGNEEIPLNPTLRESHQIDSACYFNELIVQGPVHIRETLDNENFDSLFGDLVQRPDDPKHELIIPSLKETEQLNLPIDSHVEDGRLSEIPLEDFVTKNTEQILRNLTHLNAHVYFYQLRLAENKTYDGVQLDRLMNEGIFIDQPINSPQMNLNFIVNPEFHDLKVISKLNNLFLAKDYQTLNEDYYTESANFDLLQIKQADVGYDITGEGLLNGYHNSDDIYVQELILPQGLNTENLQGVNADYLLKFLNQQLDELPLLVLYGQLNVEKMLVSGDIQIHSKLNNLDWSQLEREVVWLDRPNELKTRWLCKKQPIFAKNLNIEGSYNGIMLPEILDDIVYRRENEEIVIKGPKSFSSPTKVVENLQIEALNGISFDQLAQTKHPLNITGNVQLNGNLYVLDLHLKGNLNHEKPQELEKYLVWNNTLDSFVMKGIWHSPRITTDELIVLGHFGNQSHLPLGNFFDRLIYKNQDNIKLESHQFFTGRVDIIEGANIEVINNFPVGKLLKDMIFLDDQDDKIIIDAPISFKAPIQMNQLYAERFILPGELLNGCNVTDWLRDTIRVDQDWQSDVALTFLTGSLDNNALRVNHLNDLDLSKVVTLNKAQNFSENLNIDDLYLDGEMKVEGLVNERSLREEYENTLMINSPKEQRVETPLILPLLHVSNSLETLAAVNGNSNLNLSNVATLNERELNIQSPLYLGRLHIPDLKSDYIINTFNFTNWYMNSLWSQGRAQQIISGNWRVKDLRVKQTPHNLYRRQATKLCSQFNQMFDLLNLPYQLKNLKRSFSLRQAKNQSSIRRVFAVEKPKQKEYYLMINEVGCWTRIYKWNGTRFHHNGAFQSGPIDDVKVIQSTDEQFTFMTSYELEDDEHETNWNCTGLNRLQSWRTENEMELEPFDLPVQTMEDLRDRYEEPQYQQAFRYLHRPKIESDFKYRVDAKDDKAESIGRVHQRLLKNLIFRLQTEINITQLMIPESDLYDNYLIEDFLHLMHDLEGFHKELPTETLHLPDSPARVLAARSSQLIWNVLQELYRTMKEGGEGRENEIMLLEQTLMDVLLMANNNHTLDNTKQLHDVIQRLRELQHEIKANKYDGDDISTSASTRQDTYQLGSGYWRPIQTIRMHVGSSQRPRLLYARLTLLSGESLPPATPSTAPPAHIQLHYANGSLFQSLAADRQTRQLCALRIKDETLLAFVEGCCRIRVFIYRGVQGFVVFSQFEARGATSDSPVLQLKALRLPLQKPPGAQYVFAVILSRKVTFYEVVISGLLEPWFQCK
ncbi:uncharacterized protein Dwil_GK16233 [Drosophila willistoni]|uniref:VWFD domain-containing protein n=1 Tax=Drosophila willistoni TaxID=7260 RepID=B4N1T6_DROWI|nr:uncharacterized protein LOC6644675 [Drosophila willistoni]EDW78325.2 uncharacterized protein Dwil_GK16233 [Drosophila willistoni]